MVWVRPSLLNSAFSRSCTNGPAPPAAKRTTPKCVEIARGTLQDTTIRRSLGASSCRVSTKRGAGLSVGVEVSGGGGTRTLTGGVLSALPLPLGYTPGHHTRQAANVLRPNLYV